MSPEAQTINASIVQSILTMRATVYGRAGDGGFTAVLRSDLPCRLEALGQQTGGTAPQRADGSQQGNFRWDATYDLPESAVQIAVDAYPVQRWVPIPGTSWPDVLPGIGSIGKTCNVVRAKS